MDYEHLTAEERATLMVMRADGCSKRVVARCLGRQQRLPFSLLTSSFCSAPAEPILSSRPAHRNHRRAQWPSRPRTSRARQGSALTAASTAITSECVGARNIQSERFRTLTKNTAHQQTPSIVALGI